MAFPALVRLVRPTTAALSGTGTAWSNASQAIDGTTSAASVTLAAGASSQDLKLTNLDLSWFDSDGYDMSGVTVVYRAQAPSGVTLSEVYLVDEAGADLGANMGPVAMPTSAAYATFAQDVTIPLTTFGDAAFGVRLKAANATGSAQTLYLSDLQIIPRFTRKDVGGDAYGLQIFDASGALKISSTGTFARYLGAIDKDGGYTGTDGFAGFNDARGVLFIAGHYEKWSVGSFVQLAAGTAWGANKSLRGHAMEYPAFTWDNTAKELTTATGGNYPLPSGFDLQGNPSPGWSAWFYHYR